MDKTCLEIRDLVALGSDTSSNERIAIEAHVAVCAECARELSETRSMLGHLAALREGDMPPGTAERIWSGVKTAVPGGRRSMILQWSLRAAAMLVIGVSIGFSARSIAGRTPETGAVDELEDSRPTLVPNMRPTDATDRAEPVPQGTLPTTQFVPQAWSQHYLPFVDEILQPDVVRF